MQQGSTAEIEAVLIRILSNYNQVGAAIDGHTRIVADLGLESVRVLEFITEVEDHFDLIIDIESLAGANTVAEVARVVAVRLAAA
jgi:acyl carrier protein